MTEHGPPKGGTSSEAGTRALLSEPTFLAFDDDPSSPRVERFPHCDKDVLHAPADCEFCALPEHAVLQAYRDEQGINRTGERSPGKKPCPAELARPRERIEAWPGNRPSPGGGSS